MAESKDKGGKGGDKDDTGGSGKENGRGVPSAVLSQAAPSSAVTGDPSSGNGLQASSASAGGSGDAGNRKKHDDKASAPLTASGTGQSTTDPAPSASHDSSQGGGQGASGQGGGGQNGDGGRNGDGGQNGDGGHGGGRGPHH